jgi:hypothetical protein
VLSWDMFLMWHVIFALGLSGLMDHTDNAHSIKFARNMCVQNHILIFLFQYIRDIWLVSSKKCTYKFIWEMLWQEYNVSNSFNRVRYQHYWIKAPSVARTACLKNGIKIILTPFINESILHLFFMIHRHRVDQINNDTKNGFYSRTHPIFGMF